MLFEDKISISPWLAAELVDCYTGLADYWLVANHTPSLQAFPTSIETFFQRTERNYINFFVQ